jgi:AbrB family looped-hinge helix DNA binding protein
VAKVTSKLQITIPKRIADQYGIAPGDEIEFVPGAEGVRLVPARARAALQLGREERLRLFDAATARQREREREMPLPATAPSRDWRRDDLYSRGEPR